MSKSNQVALDKPVAVEFTISMETEKAYIVKNLTLLGQDYIADTVLPKMYTRIDATSKGITKASVEAIVTEKVFASRACFLTFLKMHHTTKYDIGAIPCCML